MEDFEYINNELGTDFKDNDEISWIILSKNYTLSEAFIDKFQNKLDWDWLSYSQPLSEEFIESHLDKIKWTLISCHQKLSEKFIEKHINDVNLSLISKHQKLSEDFIAKFRKKLNMINILTYQKLSEKFIEEKWLLYKLHYLNYILAYQKLSDKFIEAHNLNVDKDNLWQYKSTEFKKQELISTNLYECYDDYFIAYKAIRKDRYSFFNFQYQYLPGETYESTCDCTNYEDSFGLNVGTYDFAKYYLNDRKGIIVKCKVYYKDIGRIVHDGEKVRCFKMTVLE